MSAEASGTEGLLLVDKPSGPTSHEVVAQVRRLLRARRVGHAGTLDPAASGLLLVLVGRATRLAPYLDDEPKRYVGRLQLGLRTDTDDTTGATLAVHEGRWPDRVQVLAAAQRFVGTFPQVPPRFSARKVRGRPLYAWARRGEPREGAPRQVTVHRFRLAPSGGERLWDFEVEVSSGTYVRALARDLGDALGTGGVLVALRRVAVGPWRVEQAVALETRVGRDRLAERLREALLPLEAIPLRAATVRLEPEQARRFVHGEQLPWPGYAVGYARALDPEGNLLGVGEFAAGQLRPRAVLAR